MRYMLENKVYDTEKAKEIIKYTKSIEHKGAFGYHFYPRYEHTLYKSNKGQFFVHVGDYVGSEISYQDKDYIELLSENEVKAILNRLNEIDLYNELFDDLEEG